VLPHLVLVPVVAVLEALTSGEVAASNTGAQAARRPWRSSDTARQQAGQVSSAHMQQHHVCCLPELQLLLRGRYIPRW
jgi:hypothetical protein